VDLLGTLVISLLLFVSAEGQFVQAAVWCWRTYWWEWDDAHLCLSPAKGCLLPLIVLRNFLFVC